VKTYDYFHDRGPALDFDFDCVFARVDVMTCALDCDFDFCDGAGAGASMTGLFRDLSHRERSFPDHRAQSASSACHAYPFSIPAPV
jgi:hypothetical protein